MRRTYLVSGVVQGVGFREFTRQEGRRIGVIGWVRNLDDGRVEALAGGSASQLDEFERAIRLGPAGASVTDIHIMETPHEVLQLMTFEIK